MKILFEFFNFRSSLLGGFFRKGVLKICSKFKGEDKLQSNFIETTPRHGGFPVNLLHIFRTPVSKNTCGGLLLQFLPNILTDIVDLELRKISLWYSFTVLLLVSKVLALTVTKHIYSFKVDVINIYIYFFRSHCFLSSKEILI